MNAIDMLTGPFAQAIGWALLHLLWQATIVAGILAASLALLPRENANARYLTSCGALALVFTMFVATAVRAYDPAAAPVTITESNSESVNVPLTRVPIVIVATAAESWRDRAVDTVTTARQSLPTVVALWMLGVFVLSSRLVVSWFRARALVTRNAVEASPDWQRAAARISDALGLKRAVRLLESAAVEVPSVIGTLRPVILLPASALTGLTPEQIEMVLAHELAHIRRHDFLMNLLQAFVETLMFYHPAVWWMSRRVRIERENCCDDLAVAVCGNALQYAKALTRLEELRAGALPVVVAANGGSLLDRIRRIAADRAESTANGSRWAAAVTMLAILAVALAVPSLPALAQREAAPQAAEAQVSVVAPAAEPVREQDEARVDSRPSDDDDPDANYDYDYDYDFESPEIPDVPDAPPTPDAPEAPEAPESPEWPVVAPPHAAAPAWPPVPAAAPLPPVPPTPRSVRLRGRDRDRHREFDRNVDAAIDAAVDRDDDDRDSDGKLRIDDLIALRATGATPEYIREMRGIFPAVRLRDISAMSALGVTPAFVRDMRSAGMQIGDVNDIVALKAVGVTPHYIQQMREAGFAVTNADDAAGLRAVGVSPDFVRGMRDAGLPVKSAEEATSLAAVGVKPEYVRAMRDAGVTITTADDATSLRALGVTPEFVRKLTAAGYTKLSVRELTDLAAHGIDGDFLREMSKYRDNH